MSMRTQPLPVVFAVTVLWMGAVVGTTLATSAVRDAAAYVAVAIGAVGTAAVLTVVVARQRRRERLGTLSEPARYRLAIQTGEVSGDVSRWPAWIRRDLTLTRVSLFLYVVFPASCGLLFYWAWVLGAAVHPWAMVPISVSCGVVVCQQWRTRRRLQSLDGTLAASHVAWASSLRS